MSPPQQQYRESPSTKTKIVATVGPACDSPAMLRQLVLAGVDIFRLNFAHGSFDQMAERTLAIRKIAADLHRQVGILGDLGGPKIRLGNLPGGSMYLEHGARYTFASEADPDDPTTLTTTYDGLIDDLRVGDPILLADGTVSMRVIVKPPGKAVCTVEQPGRLSSGQGVNLPGVDLQMPSITEKDRADLAWAVDHGLDFIGLSFVRRAEDIRELRALIAEHNPEHPPIIVAKIEKPEAVEQLEDILAETDAVMVARGDLGVEVDIVRVPKLQKQIIRACNRQRVPVITATQMLDSMESNSRPTRPEASDVANAVLDGSDAVMLSGETAIGEYPLEAVTMMSRIIRETEPLVVPNKELPMGVYSRHDATQITRAVTLGAMYAAEKIEANLLVVLSHSGKSAMALSGLRSPIPIVAVTDNQRTARSMCIAWGVTGVVSDACSALPQDWMEFVVDWGQKQGLLKQGDCVVLVGTTDWSRAGKDVILVRSVS